MYHDLYVIEQKLENITFFSSENYPFLQVVKYFSILHGHVCVMYLSLEEWQKKCFHNQIFMKECARCKCNFHSDQLTELPSLAEEPTK